MYKNTIWRGHVHLLSRFFYTLTSIVSFLYLSVVKSESCWIGSFLETWKWAFESCYMMNKPTCAGSAQHVAHGGIAGGVTYLLCISRCLFQILYMNMFFVYCHTTLPSYTLVAQTQ